MAIFHPYVDAPERFLLYNIYYILFYYAESGTAMVASQDYPFLLTSFPLVTQQVFQYACYSQMLNKNACDKIGMALARACEVCV